MMKFVAFVLTSMFLVLTHPLADDNVYTLHDGNNTPCGDKGKTNTPKVQDLNHHKNRPSGPSEGDIDPSITLAAMLLPPEGDNGDDDRFSNEKGARIQGYVVSVKTSKTPESCNCDAKNPIDQDTHIEVALSKNAPENHCVIVEVTPRLRKTMAAMGEDWSSTALEKQLKGNWVEFTGWMTFDFMHADKSENTNPGGRGNFRATAWEVHPVTNFRVFNQPPANIPELHPTHLNMFRAMASQRVTADPKKQEALKQRLAKYTEGLTDEEKLEKVNEEKDRR